MTGFEVDMDEVVDRIREQGVWAYVEQTGGGCATIYAGAWHTVPDGQYDRTMYAAVAGPGAYSWDSRPSIGHTDEFFIGADDQCESDPIDCSQLDIRSARDMADLIVAQARLPLGNYLRPRRARRILQHKPRRWPTNWPRVRPTRCSPRCSCRAGALTN